MSACRRHYPGRSDGTDSLVLLHRLRPSPDYRWVGSCIISFEACSAFTRVTTCRLAESPNATLSTGGFSGFVASTAAPIATGRSDPVPRAGLSSRCAPAPFTAHCKHLFTASTATKDPVRLKRTWTITAGRRLVLRRRSSPGNKPEHDCSGYLQWD